MVRTLVRTLVRTYTCTTRYQLVEYVPGTIWYHGTRTRVPWYTLVHSGVRTTLPGSSLEYHGTMVPTYVRGTYMCTRIPPWCTCVRTCSTMVHLTCTRTTTWYTLPMVRTRTMVLEYVHVYSTMVVHMYLVPHGTMVVPSIPILVRTYRYMCTYVRTSGTNWYSS
jgi:hypothetical protein